MSRNTKAKTNTEVTTKRASAAKRQGGERKSPRMSQKATVQAAPIPTPEEKRKRPARKSAKEETLAKLQRAHNSLTNTIGRVSRWEEVPAIAENLQESLGALEEAMDHLTALPDDFKPAHDNRSALLGVRRNSALEVGESVELTEAGQEIWAEVVPERAQLTVAKMLKRGYLIEVANAKGEEILRAPMAKRHVKRA